MGLTERDVHMRVYKYGIADAILTGERIIVFAMLLLLFGSDHYYEYLATWWQTTY